MARILLIEDLAPVRVVTRRLLESAGHVVVATATAAEGLAQLRARAFDLVITDFLLPDRPAGAIVAELRRERPALPILAMSGGGHLRGDWSEKALKSGASAILRKPFDRNALLTAINPLLVLTPSEANS
jgi:CheY-like chemotaxis protein